MSGIKKFEHVDNMWKYDDNYPMFDIEITEKLDGANFRFWLDKDKKLTFGSRNVDGIELTATGGDSKSMKEFRRYMEFVTDRTDEGKLLKKGHVYFAEAMIPHKIKYDVPSNLVVGFGVYDTVHHRYLSVWEDMFHFINLPTVHVYDSYDFAGVKTALEIHQYLDAHQGDFKSWLDNKSPIEGVFLKDYVALDRHNKQVMYKSKTTAYLETARVKTKKIDRNTAVQDFFDKYVTLYRIEKKIDLMRIEGNYNPKNPIQTLSGIILHDIFQEAEIRDLVKAFRNGKSDYDLNQMIIRKIVTTDYLMKATMELKK